MEFRIYRNETSFERLITALTGNCRYHPDGRFESWSLAESSDREVRGDSGFREAGRIPDPLPGSPVYYVEVLFPVELNQRIMQPIARLILEELGLAGHQAVILGSRKVLHLVVNRVHPETFSMWLPLDDHLRISAVLRRTAKLFVWDSAPRGSRRRTRRRR